MTFAVGCDQDPAVGLGDCMQWQVAGAQGLGFSRAQAHRDELREPRIEATLRVSRAVTKRGSSTVAGEARQHALAQQQPGRQRAIESAGQQQNRPRFNEAERRGLAGRQRNPVRFYASQSRQCGDADIVAAAAGATDRNDRIGILAPQRIFEPQPLA